MARRSVRMVRGVGVVVAGLVLLVGLVVALFTATDWGRERVRGFALEQLAGQVAGRVAIERIDGDLLSGAVLANVSIEDSAGATFLRADTVALRYSLRSFLSRALIFRDVRLISPVLVLEQAEDGAWNFARLFPQDTTAPQAPAAGAFGSIVRLENVSLEDATVVVRSAWTAPDSVARGEVNAFIARQTGWVVSAGEEWRRLAMVRDLNAELPLIRLADPDSAARVFEVASATMTAYPLRPPGVVVRDLRGRVAMTEDSVWAEEVVVALPASELRTDAEYSLDDGSLHAAVTVDSLSLADLAWLRAELPAGGARGELTITRTPADMHVAGRDLDIALDSGRIAGTFDVRFGDTLRVGEADLTLERLDTRTVERLAGAGTVPVDGIASAALRLSGAAGDLALDGWAEVEERSGRTSRLRANGTIRTAADGGIDMDPLVVHLEPVHASLVRQLAPDVALAGEVRGVATIRGSSRTALDVDADLAHAAAGTGRSRVLADGAVDLVDVIRARALRIRFAPLRMALIEQFSPGLPIDGALEGQAVVDGSPMSVLRARVDATHTAETGTSRVQGDATWRSGGAFDLDLNMPTLALATVGRFAPAAGLQGSVSGGVRANGTLERFTYAVNLATPDSGAIESAGTVAMDGTVRYDVGADLRSLDLRTLIARAPETRLTGRITADGHDTDPATMQATLAADLVDTHLSGAAVDTSHIRMRVADGIAHVDRARLRLASATAELEGAFGLVAGAPGSLAYRVDVAQLGDFARYLPADTGMIPPRPVAQARRIASARADSMRTALATQVQRAATGLPAEPELTVDSVQPLARDSVAGRIAARGTLNGTVQRFDLRGDLTAEDVVAAGASLRRARAEYALTDFGSDDADVTLDVGIDSPAVAGFAFDSADVGVRYRGVRDRGQGTLDVGLFQDPSRDYRVASDFVLELDRRAMTFNELVLRFDTVRWTAPHSGAVSWAGSAITVDSLELESDTGEGRITVAGRIDDDASSDVRLSVQALPLAQIAALLQDTLTASGLLDLDTHMRGSTAAPELEGNIALRGASLEDRELPDLRAGFDYAAKLLRAEAELQENGRPLLSATARLPVNLAFTGVEGPRLVDEPLGIEAHADSLPLEALPSFTPSVSDVRGRVRGDVVVGGTWDAPVLNGGIDLDLASLRIVPAGVWLRDIAGAVVLAGDAITVDSLNANSGGGPIRVTGSIDVERLTAPAFDLRVNAENAVLFDTDQGTVRTDADLVIVGPVDSARIEGEVQVREGVLIIPDVGEGKRVTALDDASVLPMVDSARIDEEILPTPNPFLRNLSLDVGLRVARDTWVRNTDANVEIYTPPEADPLRVRYNVGQPGLALDGVIHADRGEYEFAGRIFDLTTGAVTFLPGSLDPLLQLSANYEVAQRGREALVIQIHLTGQLSKPRIALESTAEPPLSESDLLSYLAFGRESSSVLSSSDAGLTGGNRGIGALAQQQIAGMALGTVVNSAMSSLERRGSRALDVFRIRPAQLPDEFAFAGALDNFLRGTEIEAGKYVTTGVFVAAEGSPSGEAWPGLRIEYETATGFSWRAVWEPRFLPNRPSFSLEENARTTRVLGTFLYWSRRF